MAFVSLNCPNCGAAIELDNSREFGFCQYCGTKIVQDKIVVEHRGSVSIDRTNEIDNLLNRAQEMINKNAFREAEVYFNRVLDIDTTNSIARKGLDLCYKIIYEPNVTIRRVPSNTYNNNAPMPIYVDGVKYVLLNTGEKKSLKLAVGTHQIKAVFPMGSKNKPIEITINNRFDRFNLTFKAKLMGKVDIEFN